MSKFSTNHIFSEQNGRLIRATFKKAYISAIYTGSNTVDVYFASNPQTVIRNIPVASSVNLSLAAVGQRCRVDIFDETNPFDMVLAFTY